MGNKERKLRGVCGCKRDREMGMTSILLSRRQKGTIRQKLGRNSPASQKVEETEANYGRKLNKLDLYSVCQTQLFQLFSKDTRVQHMKRWKAANPYKWQQATD